MIVNNVKNNPVFGKTNLNVLVSILLFLILASCSVAENTIISEAKSPDARYNAIVFSRSTGATTRDSYQLTILNNDEALPNLSGNTFISYSTFDIEWQDSDNLVVYIDKSSNNPRDSEIFKQIKSIYDINVEYRSRDD